MTPPTPSRDPSISPSGNQPNGDLVERIAQRVVELLRDDQPLLAATDVARRLGRSRRWVYSNGAILGAIPLGDGDRPRLGFEPAKVAEYLSACETSRRTAEPAKRSPAPTRRRSPTPKRQGDGGLLPIRGRKPAR